MVNGRHKGAAFERQICKMLAEEIGDLNWRRDLEQYRAGGHGDIICDDPDWPFVLELKRYKEGGVVPPTQWWFQAVFAAKEVGKLPALVYKYDRQPIMVQLHLATVMGNKDHDDDMLCQMEWDEFMYLVREMMS